MITGVGVEILHAIRAWLAEKCSLGKQSENYSKLIFTQKKETFTTDLKISVW